MNVRMPAQGPCVQAGFRGGSRKQSDSHADNAWSRRRASARRCMLSSQLIHSHHWYFRAGSRCFGLRQLCIIIMGWPRIVQNSRALVSQASSELSQKVVKRMRLFAMANRGRARAEVDDGTGGEPVDEPVDTELVAGNGRLHGSQTDAWSLVVQDGVGDIEPMAHDFHYHQPEAAGLSHGVSEACGAQPAGSTDAGAVVGDTRIARAELVSYELSEPPSSETEEVDRGRRDVHGTRLDIHGVQPAEPQQSTLTEQTLLRSLSSDKVDIELARWGVLEDETGRIILDYLPHSQTEVKSSDAGAKNPPDSQPIESSDTFTNNGGFHGSQAEAVGREVGVRRRARDEVGDGGRRKVYTTSVEVENPRSAESHASVEIETESTDRTVKGSHVPLARGEGSETPSYQPVELAEADANGVASSSLAERENPELRRLVCQCICGYPVWQSIRRAVLTTNILFSWPDSDPKAPKLVDQDVVRKVTESLNDRYKKWKEWYDTRASDTSPHKVTIYSDEELRENAKLDAPLQVKHTTTKPVISSSLASEPCECLGLDGLLSKFNELLGTSHSVETPGLRGVLEQCIERRYDFGMAFGRLRSVWVSSFEQTETFPSTWKRVPRSDFSNLIQVLDDRERRDKEDRTNAVDPKNNMITKPDIGPRRVWDLISNRIVPIYVVHERHLVDIFGRIWPVSHSWMAEERRRNVDTPINGHEWLVPLPDDTSLDRIRIELLNLGAEYAWVDVLCLRQEDNRKVENEELRKLEWELDVPTIGSVYRWNGNIVTYLNGLGRPFAIGDTKSERHWLNRAWTLQEGSVNTLIAGAARPLLLSQIPDFRPLDASELQVMQFYGELCMALNAGASGWNGLFPPVEAMINREVSYGIDKVAGLTYLLQQYGSGGLPAYLRGKNDSAACENAWSVLIPKMDHRYRLQLVFLYPVPGDDGISWRLSWRQLTAREIPLAPLAIVAQSLTFSLNGTVEGDGSITFRAHLIRSCTIQLLAEPDEEEFCRRGTLTVIVGSSNEGRHFFTVEAHHQQPIPEDHNYVLVGYLGPLFAVDCLFWIVGTATELGSIRKVTVLRMESEDDRRRLRELNLAPLRRVKFI